MRHVNKRVGLYLMIDISFQPLESFFEVASVLPRQGLPLGQADPETFLPPPVVVPVLC